MVLDGIPPGIPARPGGTLAHSRHLVVADNELAKKGLIGRVIVLSKNLSPDNLNKV